MCYVRILTFLTACVCFQSRLAADGEVERIRDALAARIPAGKILHVRYEAEGTHFVSDLPRSGTDPLGPDLDYSGAEVEVWIAPHIDSVRKRAKELVPFVPETGFCSLSESSYDAVAQGSNILARHESEEFEYQAGSTQTVVATKFRDVTDIPIYAVAGLPNLCGDFRLWMNDVSDVVVEKDASGLIELSWTAEYDSRTVLQLTAEPELALKAAFFYLGDMLTDECKVNSHRKVGEALVPDQIAFIRHGFTDGQKFEEGIKRLAVAEFTTEPVESVFDMKIPTDSVVLDDLEPQKLKKMDASGSLVVIDGTDRAKRWYESALLWLLVTGALVAVTFLVLNRSS